MNCHWKSFINLAPSKLLLMLYLVGLNATSCTSPMRMLPWWKSGWCMQLHSLVFVIVLMLLWQFCELVDVWHTSSAHIVPQPTLMAVPIHIVPHLVTCVPLVANRGPPIVMCPGNPLAVFSPCLHGNRLLFAQTEGDGTLLSVVVEPSWLGLVHKG